MGRPSYAIENSFTGLVAGVDEAGCGPWAGPVVAAAVVFHSRRLPKDMNDSKKIPPERREELYAIIVSRAHTGVGIASVDEIDALNILEARKLAMQRAIGVLGVAPDIAMVDGNRAPQLPCKVHLVVGGDEKSLTIASASIIAKVTRDRIMQQLALEHPGYGWERNMGYGTEEHQQALARMGVNAHHRRSFAPIRALLAAAAA